MLTKSERALSLSFHWTKVFIAALLVTVPIAAGSSANAADFSFITLDVPGETSTMPNSINDGGQIVGNFFEHLVPHGFLYSGGSFITIDVPGATYTSANGINNAGQIVGSF